MITPLPDRGVGRARPGSTEKLGVGLAVYGHAP